MLGGEGHVSEHVGFSVVHAVAQLRPAGAELVGDMPPGLHRRGVTWLEEDLPDRSRHHGCLALGHVRQRIPHEVDAGTVEEVPFETAILESVVDLRCWDARSEISWSCS